MIVLILLAIIISMHSLLINSDYVYPHPLYSSTIHYDNTSINDYGTRRRLDLLSSKSNPLFQGYGTHYSFIWVGSPVPQRVSVIIDTGSHNTAFPCVGCKCAKHMDPFFDIKKSKSGSELSCSGVAGRCYVIQSYSEGSSWKAYKVKDKVLVGGNTKPSTNELDNLSVDFTFHCQESESGLFRTQLVDGIMGLAAREEGLPWVLYANNITTTKAFALCFRQQGGLMTLGGVDTTIHDSKTTYVELKDNSKGFYAVYLHDILLKSPKDNSTASIGVSPLQLNSGKGIIIDSGTTDTYFPITTKSNFTKQFYKITSLHYSSGITVHKSKLFSHLLPSIVYRFQGSDGNPVDIERPWSSYTEITNDGFLAFRIYLKEHSGIVLGANFMNNMNVIFDIERKVIGMANSHC